MISMFETSQKAEALFPCLLLSSNIHIFIQQSTQRGTKGYQKMYYFFLTIYKF